MKKYIVFCISIMMVSCSSSVTLSTYYPNKKEYELTFGWMLVDEVQEETLTQSEIERQYEVILNQVLESDPNTKTCSIIKNSFHYFEHGCCAAARAICQQAVDFEVSEGTYNSEGIPLHTYKLRKK